MTEVQSDRWRLKTVRPSFQSNPYRFCLEDKELETDYYFDDVEIGLSLGFGDVVELLDHNGDPVQIFQQETFGELLISNFASIQKFGELKAATSEEVEPEEMPAIVQKGMLGPSEMEEAVSTLTQAMEQADFNALPDETVIKLLNMKGDLLDVKDELHREHE